jgi:hypothetical protein
MVERCGVRTTPTTVRTPSARRAAALCSMVGSVYFAP